jgi:phosphatidylinositol glycan class B
VLSASIVSDRLYYDMWTFPPLQWLNFNINQSLAVFYGVNRWDYYLTQAIPILLTFYLPWTLWGAVSSLLLKKSTKNHSITQQARSQLVITVITSVAVLSFVSHKEVRFIYPLLPIMHVIAAPHLQHFFTRTISTPTTRPLGSIRKSAQPSEKVYVLRRKVLLLLIATTNILLGLYTTVVHQRGSIDILNQVRSDFEAHQATGLPLDADVFVAFLTPCHTTPWRSQLIYPSLTAWALTCEPPVHIRANSFMRAAYRDESYRFFDDPSDFLRREVGSIARPRPRYLVGFEGVEDAVMAWAYDSSLRMHRHWEGFNSHFHHDSRRKGKLVIWQLSGGGA